MNTLLGELGKKLAERWVSLLALPGLLYLATATIAVTLGHSHALDYGLLRDTLSDWFTDPDLRSAGTVTLLLTGILLGSVAVGVGADAVGRLVERLWHLPPGRRSPLRLLTYRRNKRWQREVRCADAPTVSSAELLRAVAAADRICALEPGRPTWTGDRFRVTRERIRQSYGLDLDAAWPRLWLVLPDTTKEELTTAAGTYRAAARRWGWTLLYTALICWWFPAALITVGMVISAQLKVRNATHGLTTLIEATVDVHYRDLVAAMGIDPQHGQADPGSGEALSAWFRKSRWDPDSPLFK
ncbi:MULTISPECIES: hypothetical protein [Streptomyces]|uniref:Vegetative cell wall protein gp1 n=2 Tax=Streptomyces TaxID=1883 RepID=A0A420UWU3_9ACTN|nr:MULTISPECIES: hypothetical protein [Streptomyces]KNE83881.1 hypothetical protein ADZ36_02810 [Streptomyces fradiae]OFA55759.1 hypothetical protein BEN35_07440 [Streptomyces fradiae]PQM23884.1 hypothetical protein Sfr7A_09875 [Streptomyces xinghaiensis]RKM92005.1 hypothetical protein SFRA_026545 [Streptomyces xinghaiensis]RNC73576.1 hypothetical protein DC095_015995 [Streptomyces xinghaiensis]